MGIIQWVIQGVLDYGLQAAVGLLVVYMIGRLRHLDSKWANTLLYSLLSLFLTLFIIVGFAALSWFRTSARQTVTPENVETRIREWSENFGFSVGRDQDPGATDAYFSLAITTKNNTKLIVRRLKGMDRYVMILAALTLSPDVRALLVKLPRDKVFHLANGVRVELSRARIGYNIEIPLEDPTRPGGIVINRRIPITNQLTEDAFVRAVDEVTAALILAGNAFQLRLEGSGQP